MTATLTTTAPTAAGTGARVRDRRPRLGLVRRVRAEIAAGRYLTATKLDAAVERLLVEITR